MEDNFKRNIDVAAEKLNEFAESLKAAAKNNVKINSDDSKSFEVEKKQTEEITKALEELQESSEDLNDEIKDSIKAFTDLIKEISNLEINKGKDKTTFSEKTFENVEKSLFEVSKSISSLGSMTGKIEASVPVYNAPGTVLQTDLTSKEINKDLADKIEGFEARVKAEVEIRIEEEAEKTKKAEIDKFMGKMNRQISSYTSMLIGGASFSQQLFAGTVKDVTEFRKEMRLVAYQIDGITSSSRGLQNEFSNLGKNVVKETGLRLEETQSNYLKALKQGISTIDKSNKKQKSGLEVIKSGLALSTMIGSSAEQTADLFGNWYRTLGFSSHEMTVMASASRDVARTTGVTGDNLIDAMKASEGVLKNLRNQGNLTTQAARNIIAGFAEAKKLGVDDAFGRIIDAASSTNKLLFETDNKTKAFLLRTAGNMGRTDELLSGRFFKSRSNMLGMSENMLAQMSSLTSSFGENQITSFADWDKKVSQMSDDQLRALAINIKQTTGMEIDEFKRVALANRASGLGITATIEELNKTLDDGLSTVEERRKAQEDLDKALMGSGLGILSDFSTARTDLSSYMESMTEGQKKDFTMDTTALAKELGISLEGLTDTEKFEKIAVASAQKLEDVAQKSGIKTKDFSSELQKALLSGDELKVRELNEEMAKVQNQLGVKEAATVDPMEKLSYEINQLNETIRSSFSGILGRVIDTIGSGLLLFSLAVSNGLAFFGKNAIFAQSIHKVLGPAVSRLANVANGFAKATTTAIGGLTKGLGNIIGRITPAINNVLGKFGTTAGKVIGPAAAMLFGAIQGFTDAQEAGRSKTEGAILGALTGGAKTGSFLSESLGVEKGSGTDKALGVAGAAAYGAMIGAFFGPWGAAIGAAIGGVVEILKIITEGTDILAQIFMPIEKVFTGIYQVVEGIAGLVMGLITFDLNRVLGNIMHIIKGILNATVVAIYSIFANMIPGIFRLVGAIISAIGSALYSVFIEFPMWLAQQIYNGLASLASNEWIGPIFQPIISIFNILGEAIMTIIDPIIGVFEGLYNIFMKIISPITGLFSSTGKETNFLSSVLWGLKLVVKGISNVIWLLLQPLVLVAHAFAFVIKIVGALVDGIIEPFRWLYNILVGNSIVPDLVMGIISWFAKLPIMIFKSLLNIPKMIFKSLIAIPKMISRVFSNIGSYLLSFDTDTIFGSIISGIGSAFSAIASMISNITSGLETIFDIFMSIITLDFSKAWDGIKNIGSAIGNFILDGIYTVFVDFPNWLYGQFTDALSKVWEYIKSWIPGMGAATDAKKGYDENAKEQEMTRLAEGNKIAHAVGAGVGGVGDILTGDFGEGFSKIGGAAYEGVAATGETIASAAQATWEGAKSVASALNPWNWFEEGTRQITQPGLAMLHEGEMIIPAEDTKNIVAEGNGPFTHAPSNSFSENATGSFLGSATGSFLGSATGSFSGDAFSSMKDYAKTAFSSMKDYAGSAFSSIKNLVPSSIKDYAKTAFSSMKDYAGSAFSSMKDYAGSAFSSMSSAFSPMISGFTRSMEAGKGVFSSISRGINGQLMSITKGKSISEIAKSAFSGMKDYAGSAFSSIKNLVPSSIKNYAKTAFSSIKDYAGSAFSSIKNLVPSSIKNYAKTAFSSMSSAFSPMISGFKRSMEAGKGVFSSISRGINGQLMSITKGKSISEIAKSAFSGMKEKGGKLLRFGRDKGGQLLGSMKDKGGQLLGSMKNKGGQLLGSVKDKGGQLLGSVKDKSGQLLGSVKDKSGQLLGNVKEKLSKTRKLNKSLDKDSSTFSKNMKGIADGIKHFADTKVLLGSLTLIPASIGLTAMIPGYLGIRLLEKIDGKKIKSSFKGIADGMKHFGDGKFLLGSLSLIPASIGLTAMIPGYLGIRLLEKIDGKKIESSFTGLSNGISKMASPKVLLGSLALILASIGLVSMIPGLMGVALLAFAGPLAQAGLTALASGLSAFGSAAMNPMFWAGLLALAALNVALIPLAYSLSLLSPLLESFGNVIKNVFSGVSEIIMSVGESISMILSEISFEKASGLFLVAGGLVALGAAMVAFATGKFIASWVDFFSGDGIIDDIQRLSDAGPNLIDTADSVERLSGSFEKFAESTGRGWFDSNELIDEIEKFSDLSTPEFMSASISMEKLGIGIKSMSEGLASLDSEAMKKFEEFRNITLKNNDYLGMKSVNENLNTSFDTVQNLIGHAIPMVNPMVNPIDNLASPVTENSVSTAQPIHLRDVGETILRERASSESGSKLQSDELSRMEETGYRQIEELEQIKQGITTLVSLMKPTGNLSQVSENSEASYEKTKDLRRPRQSAIYGRIKYGGPSGNSNRDMINIGK